MRNVHRYLALLALIGALLLGRAAADTGSFVETDLVANLASLTFKNGIVHQALHVDPNLKNAWGITSTAASPFWVSDNNNGTSTLYNTAGTPLSLVVSIPAPGDPLGTAGTPTGTVFNIALGQGAFKISGFAKDGTPASAPAVFLFAAESGREPARLRPSEGGYLRDHRRGQLRDPQRRRRSGLQRPGHCHGPHRHDTPVRH